MRIAALGLVALVSACNSTRNPVTTNGTVLVDWDNTKSTKSGLATAKIGARTSKDFIVDVAPKDTPPIQLAVHVECAPVDYEEGGRAAHHTAPVALKVTVKDNMGWDLSGRCDAAPSYPFGPVDDAGMMQAPDVIYQACPISEHRLAGTVFKSSWRIGFTLEAYGDGAVRAFPADDVTIRPK